MSLFKKHLFFTASICLSVLIQPISAVALASPKTNDTSIVLYNEAAPKTNETAMVLYNEAAPKTNDTSIVLYNETSQKTNGAFLTSVMNEFVVKFCESYWIKNNSLIHSVAFATVETYKNIDKKQFSEVVSEVCGSVYEKGSQLLSAAYEKGSQLFSSLKQTVTAPLVLCALFLWSK